MTAATWRPATPDTFLTDRDAGDKVALRIALVIAALLHVAFLALPVIQSAPVIVAKESRPIELQPIYIPPPPPEERPEIVPTQLDYRESVPVPLPEAPEPVFDEPVAEPVDVSVDVPVFGDELADVVPPAPPLRDIVDEGHADLILPVPIEPREELTYPKMARIIRKEGRVILQAVIDEEGRVTELEVLSGVLPDVGLDDEAVRAVSLWRYEPGTLRGRPVKVRMRVMVDFSLN